MPNLPIVPLIPHPSPVDELPGLRRALGGGPRLLVKRDDALPFAFGGNKVRKMQLVAAHALEAGADVLITSGGIQSNHARVTAAVAAKLGLHCILVVNGTRPDRAAGNALLDQLLGADVRYVKDRSERAPAMEAAADERRRAGRKPYVIPIGASTPLGACGFVGAAAELRSQVDAPPDVIIHATSSGGTQAGLAAGGSMALPGTRIIGVSADESSETLTSIIRDLLKGIPALLGLPDGMFDAAPVEVDDHFVGGGYGIATDQSREAIELLARTEALFLDPTYTAKAMAGLIARVRAREFREDQTVLFWHTGGQVGLFA
jgi:D-cysteine desulfhydrase family pyridoxal phosphate-dependent enzyme